MSEGNGRALSRDQILGAPKTQPKEVDIPEWNGKVYIRVLDVAERLHFEDLFERERRSVLPVLLSLTLSDEQGNRLFSDADIEVLKSRDAVIMTRLFKEALKHNDLEKEDVKKLEGK